MCIGKIYAYFVAKLVSYRPKDMYKGSYVSETFGISGSQLSQESTLSIQIVVYWLQLRCGRLRPLGRY